MLLPGATLKPLNLFGAGTVVAMKSCERFRGKIIWMDKQHHYHTAQNGTHSVVDDIDLQVDDPFGQTGQLLIF